MAPVRIVVGALGGALVALVLTEIFLSYLLPRRVKRDPRLVRRLQGYAWRPWRAVARRLPDATRDTLLGVFGPLGVIFGLALWVLGLMVGYAALQWAAGSHVLPGGRAGIGDDLYFSAASLVASGTGTLRSSNGFARTVQILDAASGFAVLTIVIGYLPALAQAFSRREATVSQLDARAGSPPSAGRLIVRSTERDGWPALNGYLSEWETWAAELMETHLSYPALAFFRSQHVNQSWLAALCTVLDACAFAVAAAPAGSVDSARFTFAIGRHAVVDLSYTFHTGLLEPASDRLPSSELVQLLGDLGRAGVELGASAATIEARLRRMRSFYEPYINALSSLLELPLPPWIAPESLSDNWRTTEWH